MAVALESSLQRPVFSSQGIKLSQLLQDAQTRWLKPIEICEILNNHAVFPLSTDAPNQPTSGSTFLFDKTKVRHFRKDGHNWRKKNDGKTNREAHEKLKDGSKDVIHCYYARGEDNPSFQRRCYWLLERAYKHIVLVHYREETEDNRSKLSQPSFDVPQMQPHAASESMPTTSQDSNFLNPGLGHMEQYEEQLLPAINQGSYDQELPHNEDPAMLEKMEYGISSLNKLSSADTLDLSAWSSLLECPFEMEDNPLSSMKQSDQHARSAPNLVCNFDLMETRDLVPLNAGLSRGFKMPIETSIEEHLQPVKQELQSPKYIEIGMLNEKNRLDNSIQQQEERHVQLQDHLLTYQTQELFHSKTFDIGSELQDLNHGLLSPNVSELMQSIQSDAAKRIERENSQDLLEHWVSKGLYNNISNSVPGFSSTSEASCVELEDQYTVEDPILSQQVHLDAVEDPSLLQKQRFSILDFTPEWSYCSQETKVIVTGIFMDAVTSSFVDTRWCCMFGEVEVPAEILQSGVLRCNSPIHAPGRVPFCVTANDRVACSEVREFEFINKPSSTLGELATGKQSIHQEEEVLLQIRLCHLLSTAENHSLPIFEQKASATLGYLEVDSSAWMQIEDLAKGKGKRFEDVKEQLLQTFLKSKLQQWLVAKLQDPNEVLDLDKNGQGVLHMVSALGYEWAISPILAAGAGINFRDANGWTGLHWAAHFGREITVASLLAAGADPGALTDPSPKDPMGQTAADLAARSGHVGIAGYLAEASLTSHLSSLRLNESKADKEYVALVGDEPSEFISEKSSVCASSGMTDQLPLKDTLAAVRNATQALAGIQAAFRAASFRRKQEIIDFNINEFGMTEDEARDFAAQTIQRAFRGHHKKLNLAATRIQCKYKGWKGRKDFLFLKQHVVKIQAHVRGHQVRKRYKKILWSVGVLEKAILRWRRKGSGLRGFCCDENIEDDNGDDVLRDFRQQKREAFEVALSRVKVMIHDPVAQNQYRRILEVYEKEKGALNLIDEIMSLLE